MKETSSKWLNKQKNFKNTKDTAKDTKKDNIDILSKIEKYSDNKFKEMSKILNKSKNYSIKFNKQKEQIELLDGDNKVISSEYNFYGIIKPDGRFLWAYMIPGIDKRISEKIKKIKSSSYLFENSDNKTMILFHQLLTQDSIMLNTDEIMLVNTVILYLSNDLYFLNPPNNSNNTQIVTLSKIIEKYV